MSNKENLKKEKFDSQISYFELLKIKCKNCGIEISSSKLQIPKDHKTDENTIKVDKNYLYCILLGKNQKLSSDKTFVYKIIKCMNCESKLGKLIILGNETTKSDLQKCILKIKNIIIETEKESLSNVMLKNIEQSDKFFKTNKYNEKFLDYIKLIINDCNKSCDDCIEELNYFVKIQDYFIKNGLEIEKYLLKIFDELEDGGLSFVKKFLEIIKKNKPEKDKGIKDKENISIKTNISDKNISKEKNVNEKEQEQLKRKSTKRNINKKKKKSRIID